MEIPSVRQMADPSDHRAVFIPPELFVAHHIKPDYLEFFRPRTEKVLEEYFSSDSIVQLNHNGKPDNFTPARTFLKERADVTDEELDAVFTAEGQLKPIERESINLATISAVELAEELTKRTHPIYTMINRSLDTSLPNGFNRHGLEHIDRVLERSMLYLDEQGADEETKKMLVLEVFGHDLGNLLSRANHPTLSLKLLDHLIPELKKYKHRERVQTGILLHEEPVLRQLAEHVWQSGSHNDQGKFVIDVDQTASAMAADFQPEWLALIRADKFDFGRERVTEHLKGPQALVEDAHTRVNLLMETTQANNIGNTFILELTYDQLFSKTEEARFAEITRKTTHPNTNGRRRAIVPLDMYQAHKNGFMTHSEFIEKDFWHIYEARLRIAMAATFAQNPNLTEFRVVVVDPEISHVLPNKSSLQHRERVFTRGFVEDGFRQLPHAA